ncbi:MAG: Undecaprenyl-phosphate galactose phosphotransferase [Microgenomates group bacterium GW2011_GWC1_41_20]|uniref:Undecaprenyl-phosphate galactose phosphotransferase n=7 Tax=Candidatus Woeseibacteriota TaxID=1752722 RepID=A0A0G0U819_9BACT|nr:MAG: Undecaprenyl-phosphate galactose phosphotransferase [Candidatus Woesebacteria bacterium GW2011_GWF1_40_24]KKR89551.1 MAG: Undecaprenyl-phosphate galactose phosphotransferase [Candidatus Woesebacteria bacterium GW2011_GWD1_41_12]KKR98951.1 MAG: Undecaprenyl-phosphate galactose phosphotransferase [Microgenomates group bacterium GW2011_GWC1_41_20]KKS03714.1 MAG: Undecaprenyl-phosphate galactose phosphotransferase [Candidatus Woesebacteria bacterium GW2011_GWE1_41_24]KKS16942.1 MAG: Undecap
MLYDIVKRTIDIVLSIILIIVFFPIMLVTSIVIKVTSPGPVLVEKTNSHMKRIGKGGKVFRLFKFRSMPVNADYLLTKDPRFKKLYNEYKRSSFKLHEDPRVTKFGKFIRKYSIDETPQFFNVLRGDMSMVGPRPYHADELTEQQKRYPGTEIYVKETQTVKPGITGFWQVTGRSNINFDKRIEMDADYAKKKSLLMDIMIILKTPIAMISGVGAV